MIGGALARPAERFPSLFGNSAFHKKYPYFLPCAVPAAFTAIAWLVTFIFLKETVKHPVSLRQYLGFERKNNETPTKTVPVAEEVPEDQKPLPMRKLLIRPVIVAGGNYAMLSLVDIAYRAVQPLFLSTPIALGGLGLAPHEIGQILSLFGLLNGLTQVFFFASIHDYLGSKKTFMIGIASMFLLFASFPLISWLAQTQGLGVWVWIGVVLQIVISVFIGFSYGERARRI